MSANLEASDPVMTTDRQDHLIGRVSGELAGPSLVVVGSIHGNEPAGAEAARDVLEEIQRESVPLRGDVTFLSGNMRALARRVRYVDEDLNRHWTAKRVEALATGRPDADVLSEDFDQRELYEELVAAQERARGRVSVLDLHTSSSDSRPFVTLGDTLENRQFATRYPVPIVLGIEEQLDGTMLEYLNGAGVVTLGFEGGQHYSPGSRENHVAAIWIALVATGCVAEGDAPRYLERVTQLMGEGGGHEFVEVLYRHAVRPGDRFEMKPGFENFSRVAKGALLAHDWRGPIYAPRGGMLLLPLYQRKGSDGFFIVRRVRPVWMRLSAMLRRLGAPSLMPLLPGVRRDLHDDTRLLVNTRVAKLLPLQVFHLLGYRKLRWADDLLVVSRRRR